MNGPMRVSFPVPPITTQFWTAADWQRWICNHGVVAPNVSPAQAQVALDAHPSPSSLARAAVRSARLHEEDGEHEEARKLSVLAIDMLEVSR